MRLKILLAALTLAFGSLFASFNCNVVAQTKVTFVDSSGAPVPNVDAVFFNGSLNDGLGKTIEIKDGNGTVESLEGVVAATAEGYQYSGGIVDSKDLKVVLLGVDETAPTVRQISFPLSDSLREKTRAALISAIKKRISEVELQPFEISRHMRLAGKLDPKGTLEWLKENKLPKQETMQVNNGIIDGFLREDLEAAVDMLDQIKDPMFRTYKLVSMMGELPEKHVAKPIIEQQAVAAIRNVKHAAYRIGMWAFLAEHYQISGREDSSQKIIDLHLEEVQKLPSDGWSGLPRSVFAALIVEKQSDVALKMIEGIKDPNEKFRAEGRLAFHCCRTNPKLAIELLQRYVAPEGRLFSAPLQDRQKHVANSRDATKIVYRMAGEQTAAAEELADLLKVPNERAWALGLIALRLNQANPAKAKLILDKAIDTLADPNADLNHLHTSGSTMAGLLPIAEQVAPEKVHSMIWEAAFRAIPRSQLMASHQKLQHAAGAIARYDRDLAIALLDVDKLEPGYSTENTAFHQAILKAEDLPAYAAKISSPESVDMFRHQEKLVDVLLADEETFWRSVSKPIQMEWPTHKYEVLP